MFDSLSGTITHIKEKSLTLVVNNIGFDLHVINPSHYKQDTQATFVTYMHWNQENGPSLYGFSRQLEKDIFLMIIDCPKIGPSIALSILSHLSINDFLHSIQTQNIKTLSSVNGIGEKKAEQLIVQLKHSVNKLLTSGKLAYESDQQQNFVQWQNVNDVLLSLNYSKQEIAQTIIHLTNKFNGQSPTFDQLIRASLSHLAQNKL